MILTRKIGSVNKWRQKIKKRGGFSPLSRRNLSPGAGQELMKSRAVDYPIYTLYSFSNHQRKDVKIHLKM
jgi:hypothetical protein